MPTSAAIIAATSSSSAATVLAERRRDEECLQTLQNYDSHTATIEQMQDYSSCVNRLHPHHANGVEVVVFKIIIILALLIGLFISIRADDADTGNRVVIFLVSWFVSGSVLALIAMAVMFLVS